MISNVVDPTVIQPLQDSYTSLNLQFLNLFSTLSENGINITPIIIADTDTVEKAFSIINDNFSNIYTSLNGNVDLVQSNIQNILSIGQNLITISSNTTITSTENVSLTLDSITGTIEPATEQDLYEIATLPKKYVVNLTQVNNYSVAKTDSTSTELSLGVIPFSSQQEVIDVGAAPNDGQGDPLRTAFQKINNNFAQLYSTGFFNETAYTSGTAPNQVIFTTFANSFTQGTFQINSTDPGTSSVQNIILKVNITNNENGVKWTGYGLTVDGTPITTYDVNVDSGNINILVTPLVNDYLTHFISYQVNWLGPDSVGIPLAPDGYSYGNVFVTENDVILTTE